MAHCHNSLSYMHCKVLRFDTVQRINILSELLGLKKQSWLPSTLPGEKKKKSDEVCTLNSLWYFDRICAVLMPGSTQCLCFNSKPWWRCKLVWSTHHIENISASSKAFNWQMLWSETNELMHLNSICLSQKCCAKTFIAELNPTFLY